ncbi:MAG TPA: diiron oxygenase [Mycobacteriales bacterium]|nr:diiron oxygenase [Mycobacteriales bacterium]
MSTSTLEYLPPADQLADRERTGARLLRSSAKLSFDPVTEVEWEVAQPPDVYYCPPTTSSLYGTELWEQMSTEQQVTLTKHEVASVASVGIWFEEILMQMLLRYAYDRDLTRKDIQWTLTEIADECRHSVMFATMIKAFGVANYGVGRVAHELGRIFKAISNQVLTFAGTMYVEEILDAFQREIMDDESLQPLIRQVSRIHVIEEARHISYAREETLRAQATSGRLRRAYNRVMIGMIVNQATRSLIHPRAYADAGLDPKRAMRAANANPHWRATKTRAASKVLAFFDECGLVGPENRWLLRRAGVVG